MAHECPRDGTPAFGCSSCYGHLKAKAMRGGALTKLAGPSREEYENDHDAAHPAQGKGGGAPDHDA